MQDGKTITKHEHNRAMALIVFIIINNVNHFNLVFLCFNLVITSNTK